jgi:hypothetical protein
MFHEQQIQKMAFSLSTSIVEGAWNQHYLIFFFTQIKEDSL